MVFWSSFSKKIRDSINKITFDLLKARVDRIEGDYATKTYTDAQNQAQDLKINANTTNITNNATNITDLDNKVDGVINGLQNGNIINYTGPFDPAKTYSIAQAMTYQDKWYVSNVNNNIGHTPTGSSDQYWELLSEPTINLNPYLTKTEAANTYATITTVNGINTRLTTAEQTLNTNSTNIVNLENTKANNSDVYTRTQIDNWNLKSYRARITSFYVGPISLNVGNFLITKVGFQTDLNFRDVDWDNFAVVDFFFVSARRQWAYSKPTFTSLNGGFLCIEFIAFDNDLFVNQVGTELNIRIVKNSSYIG